jgi:histidinol-phosphate phosphatase family protein
MVLVLGKPFFEYQLELLKWHGFKKFLFLIGYRGNQIENYFRDGESFGVEIKYSYDGEKLLGTGGALRKAISQLEENFLLIYGDSYMDIEYQHIICDYFEKKSFYDCKGLMTIFNNKDTLDKSNVIFNNATLIKYDKKNPCPEMEFIDYGISILCKEVFKSLRSDEFIDLADIYNDLVTIKQMSGFEVTERFYEIGNPVALEEFKKFIYGRKSILKPAIFLDRDGTLNEFVFNENTEEIDSPFSADQLRLIDGTIAALKIFQSMGYLLIVVTNQPASAKGKVKYNNLYEVNHRLKSMLSKENISIDDILICPHHPETFSSSKYKFLNKICNCRKPKPGLIKKTLEKFLVDTDRSFMIGDSYVDILSGNAAGLKTVFLGSLKCDSCKVLGDIKPDFIVKNLLEFAIHLQKTDTRRALYEALRGLEG